MIYINKYLIKLVSLLFMLSVLVLPQTGIYMNDSSAETNINNPVLNQEKVYSVEAPVSSEIQPSSSESSDSSVSSETVQTTVSLPVPSSAKKSTPSASDASKSKSGTSSPQYVAKPVPSPSGRISAGYYAAWAYYRGYSPLMIPADKLTHINYAFANISDDLRISLGDPKIDPSNFAQLNGLKKSYPHLKTLISVGGWEWSGRFSDVALTDSSRTVFAESVISFIKQYGFDGVDIDWEYPTGGGKSGNSVRAEDKENFTLLLQKLREKLDIAGASDKRKYLLSIAGGAGPTFPKKAELNLIHKYLDFATVMTYDIHGLWEKYTDFNAPLYNPGEASPQIKWSVDSSIKLWISKGFPSSKIVVGIPFFGYVYNGAQAGSDGRYSTYTSGSSLSYDKIMANYYNTTGFQRYYHPDAKVPWLYNGSVYITYDDEQSIAEKAKFITSNNLAGSAIWELSQNTDGTLIKALYNAMR